MNCDFECKKIKLMVYLHGNPQFPAVNYCVPIFLLETLLIAFISLPLKDFI